MSTTKIALHITGKVIYIKVAQGVQLVELGKPDPYPAGGPGLGTLPAGSTRHVAPGAQPWQQPSESLHRKQLMGFSPSFYATY